MGGYLGVNEVYVEPLIVVWSRDGKSHAKSLSHWEGIWWLQSRIRAQTKYVTPQQKDNWRCNQKSIFTDAEQIETAKLSDIECHGFFIVSTDGMPIQLELNQYYWIKGLLS